MSGGGTDRGTVSMAGISGMDILEIRGWRHFNYISKNSRWILESIEYSLIDFAAVFSLLAVNTSGFALCE